MTHVMHRIEENIAAGGVKAILTTENSVDISGGHEGAKCQNIRCLYYRIRRFRAEYEGSIPFTRSIPQKLS
jgi:hypothetical protein